ncbi:hypothetical protein GCM10022207_33560 [Streptomyces lannensis]|uniref:Transposase n=1 Tax=Streptomyces lannensis TaxID=766498 RepID=A0ABP7K5F9_9ACTN
MFCEVSDIAKQAPPWAENGRRPAGRAGRYDRLFAAVQAVHRPRSAADPTHGPLGRPWDQHVTSVSGTTVNIRKAVFKRNHFHG